MLTIFNINIINRRVFKITIQKIKNRIILTIFKIFIELTIEFRIEIFILIIIYFDDVFFIFDVNNNFFERKIDIIENNFYK